MIAKITRGSHPKRSGGICTGQDMRTSTITARMLTELLSVGPWLKRATGMQDTLGASDATPGGKTPRY